MLDQPDVIQLDDVLITEELVRRSPRQPDLQAENAAMRSLARQLAHSPDQMLQHLMDLAVELCDAGTAGISLIETQPSGEEVLRWVAISGRLASYEGGCTLRHFSPCGVCLERGKPVLFAYPERYFTHLQFADAPLVESLVLPVAVEGQVLGTIWIVTHDQPRQFDSEDVRLMTGLADFTTTLLRNQQQTQALQESKAQIAADLVGMRRLYELHSKLSSETDLHRALHEIVAAATEFTGTHRGCVQLVSEDGERLEMFAYQGYSPNDGFIQHFLHEGSKPACDAAHRTKQRLIIEDVETFPALLNTRDREVALADGIRATQSTPILSRQGEILGVLSTQFPHPHRSTDRELRLVDLLAWAAADFIERYKAHKALSKSEAKYRSLFDTIDAGFAIGEVIYDPSGQPVDILYREANPAASRLTGVHDFTQRRMSAIAPHWESYWVEIYDRVARSGVSERTERYAASLQRWYDFSVSRLEATAESSRPQVAVIFQDITDRKQTEATIAADLRDTQRLRELSVRFTPEEDDQVLYNEILAAAIDLTQADAGTVQILDDATQDLTLLATQGFDPDFITHFQRVNVDSPTSCGLTLRQGRRVCIDFDAPERDDPHGALQLLVEAGYRSAQSTPMVTRSGRLIGMISTHWCHHYRPTERELRFLDLLARQAADLVAQRQTEYERQQLLEREQAARAEAERANRVKDEFLAILSHELRTPLNPILGWSKLLQTQKLDAEKTQRALSTIERNAKLQTQLIDDLLDVARILRGKLKIDHHRVNLVTVIEAALEVVSNSAEAKGVALQFDPVAVCEVRGDEGRLQQVVWNLLSNAIKFTPAGGQVKVRLEPVVGEVDEVSGVGETPDPAPQPPSYPATPTYAQITVTDTGKGIRRDFLPNLFQAFRQEDASITRQYGGLGLGLSIVKYLVDAHGGTITADSPGEGQGATFSVQLPLRQAQSDPPAIAPSSSADLDLAGIKVLAVDDSADARDLLEFALTQYGSEIVVAASGAEALAHLSTWQPDVLVCDIGMPNLNGYDLLQQMRTLPADQGGQVPAIAVTAFAREEDCQQALECGFQQHIAKPIAPQQLVDAIAQLVMK